MIHRLEEFEPFLSGVASHQETLGALALSSGEQELALVCDRREVVLDIRKATRAFLLSSAFKLFRNRRFVRSLSDSFLKNGWSFSVACGEQLVRVEGNIGGGRRLKLHFWPTVRSLLFGVKR